MKTRVMNTLLLLGSVVALLGVTLPPRAVADGINDLLKRAPEYATTEYSDSRFTEDLRKLGVNAPKDLVTYLGAEGRVRNNALRAIRLLGKADDQTLQVIEQIAKKTNDSSAEFHAVAVLLSQKKRNEIVVLSLNIVDKVQPATLNRILGWLAQQDRKWLLQDKSVPDLVERGCKRLQRIFEEEKDLGILPSEIGAVFNSFPFTERKYARFIIEAMLVAVAHPERMQDVSIYVSFDMLKKRSSDEPALVKEGLAKLVTDGSTAQAKVILWHIFRESMQKTEVGKYVVDAVAKKRPELKNFVAALEKATFNWMGAEGEVGAEIADALKKLRSPER
jgi:hypothetical protein